MSSRTDILAYWENQFEQSGLDSPRLSAQVLLSRVLGISRLEMLLDARASVPMSAVAAMESLSRRRLHGEPVAYLVGIKEFYGIDFEVSPAVLIPRPETELFVDRLLASHDRSAEMTVLDLGTGSGVLAVTCAVYFPNALVTAVDISPAALEVARRNASRHNVQDRVLFVQGNLIDAVHVGSFDVILANLPYVPESMRNSLSHEVVAHEPEVALFAGQDGLDLYRRLVAGLAGRAKPGTQLLCEIDCGQGQAMLELFKPVVREVLVEKDYAGLDRLVYVVF
jgi:release factor glutamine methyltransferase